ncbi:MAG: 2-hydroxyacid dehydrogenase [Arenicella sp.]
MAILLNNNGFDNASWQETLTELLPAMPVYCFPDIPDPEEIKYALVWNHPHGDLRNYPNLQAILILGAGTEHLDSDPGLPDVPVVRLIDPAVVNDMALYALYWVTHFHRRYDDYRQQAQQRYWLAHDVCATQDFRVTVLGLGEIGGPVAQRMALNGYKAQGWSRSQRQIDGVETYNGNCGLDIVLQRTDVLVNCLPLTEKTYHFLHEHNLSLLPAGACIINLGRGATIDDKALLALLDAGHLNGAALDTFAEEPLSAESPFWLHQNVHVTPHIAGNAYARSAAKVIVTNIQKLELGELPFPMHVPPQHQQKN